MNNHKQEPLDTVVARYNMRFYAGDDTTYRAFKVLFQEIEHLREKNRMIDGVVAKLVQKNVQQEETITPTIPRCGSCKHFDSKFNECKYWSNYYSVDSPNTTKNGFCHNHSDWNKPEPCPGIKIGGSSQC